MDGWMDDDDDYKTVKTRPCKILTWNSVSNWTHIVFTFSVRVSIVMSFSFTILSYSARTFARSCSAFSVKQQRNGTSRNTQ